MKILGIDPGLKITGFGIIEVNGRNLKCVAFGGIPANPKATFAEKLLAINEGVNKVIRQYRPDYCAAEDIYFHQNKKTAIVMGHARAVAILAAARNQVPVFEYSPREVKMSIVGNGNASKSQVQAMVKNILGLSEIPRPEDAADALAVALCHHHRMKFQKLLQGA